MQCYRDGYSDGARGFEPQSNEMFYRYFYLVGNHKFLDFISISIVAEEEKAGLACWPKNY